MKVLDYIKAFINYIKEIRKDPRKNGIMMLIIMFIFISFVVILLRVGETTTKSKDNNLPFNIEKIKKGNYHFIYSIDNNIYEGDNYIDKSLFTNNTYKYYRKENMFYKDINGKYGFIDKYEIMGDFISLDIEKIIDKSTFDSKTEYSDNRKSYTYLISTTSLVEIFDDIIIDIADIPNKITFKTDSNNEVNEINYEISPFSNYKNINVNNINIKYSKFGEVEEIENIS